jgi:hypothetical protein
VRGLANRLSSAPPAGHVIPVVYPLPDIARPRFGAGSPPNATLRAILLAGADRYRQAIDSIEGYGEELARIPRQQATATEPYWDQTWFTGVDAAALYAFIRERRPRRYHEIGSGNSTLFAAQAMRDGGLHTHILSVDPQPRAEINAICDEVIRLPMQDADPGRIAELSSGDVLLVDSSHYALMNSDVVAFFLDVLPALPRGVLVGVHDIFLPEDYPWWISQRWYTEQYLLAAWLIGQGDRANVILPTHFAVTEPTLRSVVDSAWERAGLGSLLAYGSCFWFETE